MEQSRCFYQDPQQNAFWWVKHPFDLSGEQVHFCKTYGVFDPTAALHETDLAVVLLAPRKSV